MNDLLDKLDDTQIVAVTLYGEARSEPIEGLIAVANVIKNRVQKKPWPNTFRAVCLQPWQFSCWKPEGGKANHRRVLALVKRLAVGEPVTDQPYKQCAFVAYGVVKDYLKDNTTGADHYHTATLTPRPSWAQKHVPSLQKGAHVFYTLAD